MNNVCPVCLQIMKLIDIWDDTPENGGSCIETSYQCDNYNCEGRVQAILARELRVKHMSQVGRRPWPATSVLPRRWLSEEEKHELVQRMEEN